MDEGWEAVEMKGLVVEVKLRVKFKVEVRVNRRVCQRTA